MTGQNIHLTVYDFNALSLHPDFKSKLLEKGNHLPSDPLKLHFNTVRALTSDGRMKTVREEEDLK